MILMLAATGTPAPAVDPRPVVADPVVMSMRPNGRRLATITIAQDGNAAHTTFAAAIAAGAAIQQAALTAAGLTVEQSTPNFRIDYVVKPGVYPDPMPPLPMWSAFYAADGGRGTTRVETGLNPDGGLYWEGIDITNVTAGYNPKYGIHAVGAGTTVITRCTITNPSTSSGGYPVTIGEDGVENGTTVIHDVVLASGGTNLHGWPTTVSGHQTVVFSQVTSMSAVPNIGWGALNDIAADEVWVVGGSVKTISVAGAATILHLDPATILTGPVTTTGTTDSRTDWPIPVGGLSAHDRAHFGM